MGRYLFGAAALVLGVASLVLGHQLVSAWLLPGREVFLWITSLAQIIGGLAMLFPRWLWLGATILSATYALFAVTFVPSIFAHPGEYYTWGNVFYPLGVVAGALIAAGRFPRAALVLFGLCNISYAIEQVEYFARTNSLVPAWIPLGASFWNAVTAIGFLAAGVAFILNYRASLAARLLALMFLIFVLTIWIPALITKPSMLSNWSEGLETLLLGGSAWVIADVLVGRRA